MAKGANYERSICRKLSLWWTDGKDDDVFWRVLGSGGRAKARGRKGKTTSNQHGDITFTNVIGAPLVDLLTIEIKRGYSSFTIADLLDMPRKAAVQKWEEWYYQVTESHEQAGSYAWLLITKRDKREPLVFFPLFFLKKLKEQCCFDNCKVAPYIVLHFALRDPRCTLSKICGMQLELFLEYVRPSVIRYLSRSL